jgi:thiol-disulfide isomerase/thioredoxin
MSHLITRRRVLSLGAAALLGAALPAQAASALTGVSYPDLSGRSHVLDGAWRGKVVVVNFWATWCAPCREEMPLLNQFADRYGAAPLAVVGVAIDDKTAVRNFVRQFNIRYPVLLGDGSALNVMRAAGNQLGALPFTLVLDKRGEIVGRLTGKLTEAQLDGAVRAHL